MQPGSGARARPRALERLEGDIAAWFDSPEGRFEAWDAERRRLEESA